MLKNFFLILSFLLIFLYLTYYFFIGEIYQKIKIFHRSWIGLVKYKVKIDPFDICYTHGGSGDEKIIFIHGIAVSKDTWNTMAACLMKKYQVYLVDLPGHGESSRIFSEKYTITKQTEYIENLINKLNLSNFHIAGTSMGALIAADYCAKNIENVKSLALFNSAGIYNRKKSSYLSALEKGKNLLSLKNKDDIDRFLKLIFFKSPYIPDRLRDYMYKNSLKNKSFGKKVFNDLIKEKFSIDSILPKLQKKQIFILWGEKDKIFDVDGAYYLHKKLKNSDLRIIKNSGHALIYEQPEECAKEYIQFLKR